MPRALQCRVAFCGGAVLGLCAADLHAQTSVVRSGQVDPPGSSQTSIVREAPPVSRATEDDGQPRAITQILIEYLRESAAHPAPAEVLEATVDLTPVVDGYIAARAGDRVVRVRLADLPTLTADPSGGTIRLYDSALASLAPAIVARLQHLGLVGVYAEPDPDQIRVENGEIVDARGPGITSLTFQITTGRVTEVRTVGLGERLPPDQTLNNPVHDRIRQASPVAPATDADASRDLLRSDRIDEYAMRLNRHPGRRVDVAVSVGGEEFGAVTLDYLITENRPWLLFFQLANNGTDSTDEWRERFGFIHNQLTNHDDIFSIEYLTANFDDVHSVVASYERPLGPDRLRARAFGSWYQYTAGDVGQPDADFDGDGWSVGAEAIWNFFQSRELFLDAVGGVRWEGLSVDNALADLSGQEALLLGYAGLRLERVRASTQTFAALTIEGSLDGVDGDEVDTLGRTDADDEWATLSGSLTHSFYLEPLIDPGAEEATSLAHEIALAARFQSSLDHRLIPNYQQVLGGLYTVRGYPESIVAGDDMWLLSAEYRWRIPRSLIPNPAPGSFMGRPFRYRPQYAYGPTDWDLILKAFVDVGRTQNTDPLAFEGSQTLAGAGVGVELAWTRRLNLRVDLGWALEEIESDSGGPEVDSGDFEAHFVLTVVY